jgi:hypothetical protein
MAAPDVPFLAASLLLAGAGAPKVFRPEGIVAAMRDAGLPSSAMLGRAIGAGEVVIAAIAIVVGGAGPAVAVACAYAGFIGFLTLALRRGGLESCGCFGVNDSPPSWWHVIANIALAATAVAAAAAGTPTIASIGERTTSTAVAVWLLAATSAWLVYLLLSLPQAGSASRHRPGVSTT